MLGKLFIHLLILHLCTKTLQDAVDNQIDIETDKPMKNVRGTFDKFLESDEDNDLGSLIMDAGKNFNSFVQSDEGMQLGDMLMGSLAGNNNNVIMSQILSGVGSLMQQNFEKAPKGETGGGPLGNLSPEVLGSVLSMLGGQEKTESSSGGGFNLNNILQLMLTSSRQESPVNYLSLTHNIIQSLASFVGPEAEEREKRHAEHAWMLPPFLERIHVALDHIINSEMGATLMESTGANRALKIFADEDGKFSYAKFVEMLENHSFRKHWISIATKRFADIIAYFADPYTQKKFTTTIQLFVNNFLKRQGVPKTALFEPSRPTESLTALTNYISKKFLGRKVDAKPYIQSIVNYIQTLLVMAENRGIVTTAVNSDKLSHKIADTINMEIIEPIIRVNRAYRFSRKVPECAKYVICLVNEEETDDVQSIPGLKKLLSKFASFVASWFLSGEGGTSSFWSFYNIIVEGTDCKARYLDECHEFHLEEIKVTTEYVHTEL